MIATVSETDLDFEALKAEKLDRELRDYATDHPDFGLIVRHPLVYSGLRVIPGLVNRQLVYKREALGRAIREGNYEKIVFLHERPWRLQAYIDHVSSGSPVWEESSRVQNLLMDIWVDSENIEQCQEAWRELFRDRPEGAVLGGEEELAEFALLPEKITAYRGGEEESSFISWTTDRSIAEFFAQRFNQHGTKVVTERTIEKSGVFAFLTRRGESELLTFEGEGFGNPA